MSLFDELVDQALKNKSELTPLRVVIEKELLHHDILRVLSQAGLLTHLTFIGGTCLRSCYGSSRLSEDLDFTGGIDFTREKLSEMASTLVESLKTKYGLEVIVAEPMREEGNVDTWKLKIQTRPGRRDLPAQRINIDVCSIPSYEPKPMMLLNPYGIEMGSSGLILQAQSREEIFADKLVALALRPNRIKNRDLWDIAWLHQQQVKPALELIKRKLKDHKAQPESYLDAFKQRLESMRDDATVANQFRQEMKRFLPSQIVNETVASNEFWIFLVGLLESLLNDVIISLTSQLTSRPQATSFKM